MTRVCEVDLILFCLVPGRPMGGDGTKGVRGRKGGQCNEMCHLQKMYMYQPPVCLPLSFDHFIYLYLSLYLRIRRPVFESRSRQAAQNSSNCSYSLFWAGREIGTWGNL